MVMPEMKDELSTVETQVARLNTLVIEAVTRTVQTLRTEDQDAAHSIIRADREIDELSAQIEKDAFRILVTQQPLGRSRLRYLTSLSPLTVDLERIADEAQEIAQYVCKIGALSGTASLLKPDENQEREGASVSIKQAMHHEIVVLGQEVLHMLRATVDAYTQRDQDAARFIWAQDSQVDRTAARVRRTILEHLEGTTAQELLAQDAYEVQLLTFLIGIAHQFERIADHCTNICERIVFLIEGDVDMRPTLNA
jgi:phosphate transport system protein